MCVVSNITDQFQQDWQKQYPIQPANPNDFNIPWTPPEVTKLEFDQLKKEVEALKELLVSAKKYDEITGQPNCELDEKIKFLKAVGNWIGVDLESVFTKK